MEFWERIEGARFGTSTCSNYRVDVLEPLRLILDKPDNAGIAANNQLDAVIQRPRTLLMQVTVKSPGRIDWP